MSAKRKDDLAEKARKYFRAKTAGQRGYKRADLLLAEIAKEIEPGQSIPLGEMRKAVLVDNFSGKQIVWTPCGARKYSLEIEVEV